MAYKVPAFPITCNVWRATSPVTGPPDLTLPCNLAVGRRVTAATGIPDDESPDTLLVALLLPPRSDVRDAYSPPGADIVECPAGTLRYYLVKQVDDVGRGFANEFRYAVAAKQAPWPAPIP